MSDRAHAALQRIADRNPRLNAILSVDPGAVGGSGALAGEPVVVKDCIDIAGLRTSQGSSLGAGSVAPRDAAVVERLRAAGAALVAKAHLTEFCFGATGENMHFGDCRNPWDDQRITGGSSSGSAAAVAAGMVRMALGTDTGGSVRVPAALCGVVGLRPTLGRVSNRGVLPLSLLCDTVGPIAATVKEAARLFAVIAGYDAADPVSVPFDDDPLAVLSAPVAGLRIGLPRTPFFDGLDADVACAVEQAAAALEAEGARLVDVAVADPAALADHTAFRFVLADVAQARAAEMRDHAGELGPGVRARIMLGQAVSGTDYAACLRALWRWKADLRAIFASRADVLLTPTTPVTAPLWSDSRDMVAATRAISRLTYDVGAAGTPALSVPCGFDRRGLPIGAQLIAPWGGEARLFQAGAALERALELALTPPDCSN